MSKPTEQRDPLELLAADFMERCRRQEHPTTDDYAARHPELADEIRALFPAVAAMESLRTTSEQTMREQNSAPAGQLHRLGDFRIVNEIGRGGMGIVYEAEQCSLRRRVAVKVLPKHALLDPQRLARFQREAQTAANLHHTNIVPIFGVGNQDGYHFFVMQLIQGVGLDEVVRQLKRAASGEESGEVGGGQGALGDPVRTGRCRQIAQQLLSGTFGPRPTGRDGRPAAAGSRWRDQVTALPPTLAASYWKSVARLGVQVAGALQYAHGQGTLHRDIKPANLLVDERGAVWVADFGLARAVEQSDLSHTGDLAGTFRYMAPERFEGHTDARSDIYSLGLTLYELLTLRPAWADADKSRLIQRIVHEEPVAPRVHGPDIPRDLETIVLTAMAREPRHRYQDAGQMAADLKCFLEDRPIRARRTSPGERAWRWCRRNRAVAGLAAAALGLLVLVAVVATAGYVQTRRALTGATAERKRAEATSQLAVEALDRIYNQFAPNRMVAPAALALDAADEEAYEVAVQPVLSDETAALLENMLVFYDRLADQNGMDQATFRRKVAEANGRVGDIRQRLGQFTLAERAYQRAIEIYRGLPDEFAGDASVRQETARILNELGNVYGRMFEWARATQAHASARSILEAASAAAASCHDVRYELARTHYFLARGHRFGRGRRPAGPPREGRPAPDRVPGKRSLLRGRPGGHPAASVREDGGPPPPAAQSGRLHAGPNRTHPRGPDEGKHAAAVAHFQQAVEILTDLAAAPPVAPDDRHLLALCYRDMSYRLEGPRVTAPQMKATEILEQLVQEFPTVVDYRYDLAQTYAMPYRHRPRGDEPGRDAAASGLWQALEILEKLVGEHPNVPDYRKSQAYLQQRLARLLDAANQPAAAESAYRRALELQSVLGQRYPDATFHQLGLARTQQELARLLRRQDRLDDARQLLEASIVGPQELLQAGSGESRQTGFAHLLLYDAFSTLAEILAEQGREDLAAEAAGRAGEHRPKQRMGRRRPDRAEPRRREADVAEHG